MARRRRGQFPEPKQENGQWKIRYWADEAQDDGSRKRVRKTKCLGRVEDLTLTQARKEVWRFLEPINDVAEGSEHSSKTMVQLIATWNESVKPTLKLSTQCSYEWAFQRIKPAFHGISLSAIGRADVQAFLSNAGKQLAGESVHDLRARLRGLFTCAEDWGWIRPGTNPAKGRLRLPAREPVRPKRVIWPEELQKLMLVLEKPYSTIVILAALGGIRRGELAALRWNDNLKPGTVVVDEAVYRGKLGTPKTRKSNREVSVGPVVQRAIDEWRVKARFTGSEDFMFGIRTNTPIDLHNVVARHVKPACVKAGIPEVSWHDLRHTYTTWGRLAGIKAETLRDQLGHSSVLTTLDIYSHAQDRSGEAALIEQYAWPELATEVQQ
jgi:integrase